MKNLIPLLILWLIGFGAFAQKDNADDKTQEKNKKSDQDSRYQEGASGVKRSISYKFNNLLLDEDPGNGIFRYNKDTVSGVTYIFVDVNDQSGEDQTKWYSTWDDTTGATGRGRLNLVEYEGKNVNVFDVTGVFVRGAGYWKIPVKYVSGSLPADGVTYYYIFERIENKDKSAKTDKDKTADSAAVATAAIVTVAAVITEPVPEPVVQISQPEPVVEVKEEPVAQPEPVVEVKEEPVAQPEPVVEVKEEPVAQPEPVAEVKEEPVVEVKEEPVVQQEAVKEESKVEEIAVVAAASVVTTVAVVTEPVPEPAVQITQPEPVVEVKAESVVVQEPVKEESKVKDEAAIGAVGAVAVAGQTEKPKAEPRVRTTQPAQPAPKPQSTQPAQSAPKPQTTQPAQPKTSTQTSQPKQPVQQTQPAQPARPAPTTQAPPTGTASTGYSLAKRTDGSRNWHGIIETGYGFKVSDYGLNNYRINFIGSFSLGQHFMIGLGLGYRRYFDKPEKHADWYMVSARNQVPVFLDLRVLFSKKKLTPYLALGLGSATEKSKSDTTSYGSFINPSAGVWYRLSKNTALFAGIAYEMMDLEYALHADNIPYRRKNNSVSLNIGIQF